MDASLDLPTPKSAPSLLDEATPPFLRSRTTSASTDEEPTLRYRSNSIGSSKLSQSITAGDEEVDEERERRDERDALRAINESLEATLASLSTAKAKVERFGSTVATTHALMDLYTRILSQASHTQQLLLNGEWEQSKDDERKRAEEEEERSRAEAAEREEREALEAAERAARAKEEAQRRRDAAASAPPARGRGAARARGTGIGRGAARPPSATGTASTSASETTSSMPPAAAGRGIRGSGTVTGVRGVRGLRSRVVTRGRGAHPPE